MYLADRCTRACGDFIVQIDQTEKLRKYIYRLGRKVFPAGPAITPYVYRTQSIADIKAEFGSLAAAIAAGHCNDRCQSHYGHAAHGRRGRFVAVHSAIDPKMISAPRGRRMREYNAASLFLPAI
jgi:hypothetical protein